MRTRKARTKNRYVEFCPQELSRTAKKKHAKKTCRSKRRYRTFIEAAAAADDTNGESNKSRLFQPVEAYRCRNCSQFHVTKKKVLA